ncbi:hypothetical protein GOD53_32390 [Sinorhizobium medicae]|nr:hypothetical protein [Sinorhizobium medicae]MDX0748280.1 hypothetical protein [Sinorhizobium medicae]
MRSASDRLLRDGEIGKYHRLRNALADVLVAEHLAAEQGSVKSANSNS